MCDLDKRIEQRCAAWGEYVKKNHPKVIGDVSTAIAAELYNLHPGTLRNWRHNLYGPEFYKRGGPKSHVMYSIFKLATWYEKKLNEA